MSILSAAGNPQLQHASEDGYRFLLITAEDRDVLMLSFYCSTKMFYPLHQKCGTQNPTRYKSIVKPENFVEEDICRDLVRLLALLVVT